MRSGPTIAGRSSNAVVTAPGRAATRARCVSVRMLTTRARVGYALAVLVVVIMASGLAISRAGLTSHLGPADLLVLRFGIGSVVLAPILVDNLPKLTRRVTLAALQLPLHQYRE